MGDGAGRLSISARSFPRVLPPLPEEPKSSEAQRERGFRRDGRAGVEGEDTENRPPRMNVGESAIEKALEDVQTALKATENLRLRGRMSHRGLRAPTHRPLTDRSGGNGGNETERSCEGFAAQEDKAKHEDARSWLRQPKIVSRDRDPGRRRASTGSMSQVVTTHSSLRPRLALAASEALAQARRLQKERVRAEERSRRFSLSISDRLRSAGFSELKRGNRPLWEELRGLQMTLSELCRWLRNSRGPAALRSPLCSAVFSSDNSLQSARTASLSPKKFEKRGAAHANHKRASRRCHYGGSSSPQAAGLRRGGAGLEGRAQAAQAARRGPGRVSAPPWSSGPAVLA
ncbi:unnamed protein product [Symbiodinium sp. CCMP2592]|nr:unnamed protein product [Symbiodinium sp. CCMP2592]